MRLNVSYSCESKYALFFSIQMHNMTCQEYLMMRGASEVGGYECHFKFLVVSVFSFKQFIYPAERNVVYLAFPNTLCPWCSSCVFDCRLPLSIPKKMLDKKRLDDIAQGRTGDSLR